MTFLIKCFIIYEYLKYSINSERRKEMKSLMKKVETKMKIFSCSLENLKNKPNEDYFLVSPTGKIFAVADGVTRTKLPNGLYPNPSGARMAAETFCQEAVSSLEGNIFSEKALVEAMNEANKEVFFLNEKQGVLKKLDYLVNDFFCTCGVIAAIQEENLLYGYVGDCGITVFDKQGVCKLVSKNDVKPLEELREKISFESKEKKRLFWRKELRNRPDSKLGSYGVLTGEKAVSNYYHAGKIKLEKNDLVILYTDGFFLSLAKIERLIRSCRFESEFEEKIKKFCENEFEKTSLKEVIAELKDDKTLIAIEMA